MTKFRGDGAVKDFRLIVLRQTARAVLCTDTGDEKDAFWLPLSQIEVDQPDKALNAVTVTMPLWLAKEKGLI